MKLIYLDTSNLILLSNLNQKADDGLQRFVSEWSERKYTLALSQVNLVELLSTKYGSTRNAHLKLLQLFLPFRFESEPFFQREITRTLVENGLLRLHPAQSKFGDKFFSKCILSPQDLNLVFNTYNVLSRVGLYKAMYVANSYSWKAKRPAPKQIRKPRLSDLDKGFVARRLKRLLVWFIGVDLTNPKNNNKSLDTLMADFHLRVQAKSTLRTLLGEDEESQITRGLDVLSIEDCPGLWLRHEVEKKLMQAGDLQPNNESDLDSIQYLPYVDVLVTDKRIVDKTAQVLRQPSLPDRIARVSPPRKCANTLESLVRALFAD